MRKKTTENTDPVYPPPRSWQRYWKIPVLFGVGFCALQVLVVIVRFSSMDSWNPGNFLFAIPNILFGLTLFFLGGLLVGLLAQRILRGVVGSWRIVLLVAFAVATPFAVWFSLVGGLLGPHMVVIGALVPYLLLVGTPVLIRTFWRPATKNISMCVTGGLSILYIALILFFRGNDAWVLFRAGNLNELGDFLAGFFTPLAFGWLVYGYLLQSKELRLQREELALTRDQLGKQTELLQEQVTADHHDSIPHLTISKKDPKNDWDWIVKNEGGNAKNIELFNHKQNSLAPNESFPLTFPATSTEFL